VTKHEWARPAPWVEVVAQSRGRAKYNSIRKLRARLRRLAIVRRLRHAGDIHQRGLQRQLAEELGVVRSVICEDMKQILAAGGLDGHVDERQRGIGANHRPYQAKEDTMSQRCTVRLSDALYEFLQIEAEARQCGVSDVIREALERLLGIASDQSANSPTTPKPAPLSPTHDCTERLLARLPRDVREAIVERARLLDLPVSKVVTSMLIVQQQPSQPSPQVSGTARPQTEFLRWQEINRQRQMGAASPPAVPTSGTSSSTTGART
jgi:Arc/MetJ-type ribon-helix-helix transcriptional regulator